MRNGAGTAMPDQRRPRVVQTFDTRAEAEAYERLYAAHLVKLDLAGRYGVRVEAVQYQGRWRQFGVLVVEHRHRARRAESNAETRSDADGSP